MKASIVRAPHLRAAVTPSCSWWIGVGGSPTASCLVVFTDCIIATTRAPAPWRRGGSSGPLQRPARLGAPTFGNDGGRRRFSGPDASLPFAVVARNCPQPRRHRFVHTPDAPFPFAPIRNLKRIASWAVPEPLFGAQPRTPTPASAAARAPLAGARSRCSTLALQHALVAARSRCSALSLQHALVAARSRCGPLALQHALVAARSPCSALQHPLLQHALSQQPGPLPTEDKRSLGVLNAVAGRRWNRPSCRSHRRTTPGRGGHVVGRFGTAVAQICFGEAQPPWDDLPAARRYPSADSPFAASKTHGPGQRRPQPTQTLPSASSPSAASATPNTHAP